MLVDNVKTAGCGLGRSLWIFSNNSSCWSNERSEGQRFLVYPNAKWFLI